MLVKEILQTTTTRKIFIDANGATIALKTAEYSTITDKVLKMVVKNVKAGRGFLRVEV